MSAPTNSGAAAIHPVCGARCGTTSRRISPSISSIKLTTGTWTRVQAASMHRFTEAYMSANADRNHVGVAQSVERNLAKVEVAGSKPAAHSAATSGSSVSTLLPPPETAAAPPHPLPGAAASPSLAPARALKHIYIPWSTAPRNIGPPPAGVEALCGYIRQEGDSMIPGPVPSPDGCQICLASRRAQLRELRGLS